MFATGLKFLPILITKQTVGNSYTTVKMKDKVERVLLLYVLNLYAAPEWYRVACAIEAPRSSAKSNNNSGKTGDTTLII